MACKLTVLLVTLGGALRRPDRSRGSQRRPRELRGYLDLTGRAHPIPGRHGP